MEPLLSLSNLVKHYATQKAVDDISFDIQKGSIFGLLGPNGAGKTTLLRMITGIFYPDGGTIKLDGKHFDPLLDIREIGYMPEERGLYKKMKIGEQALYLAQLRGLSKADAMEKIKYWLRFKINHMGIKNYLLLVVVLAAVFYLIDKRFNNEKDS